MDFTGGWPDGAGGAFIGSLIVAAFDTFGRAALPPLLRGVLPPNVASVVGPMLSSIAIYIVMAGVLLWKPQGLFPVRA